MEYFGISMTYVGTWMEYVGKWLEYVWISMAYLGISIKYVGNQWNTLDYRWDMPPSRAPEAQASSSRGWRQHSPSKTAGQQMPSFWAQTFDEPSPNWDLWGAAQVGFFEVGSWRPVDPRLRICVLWTPKLSPNGPVSKIATKAWHKLDAGLTHLRFGRIVWLSTISYYLR